MKNLMNKSFVFLGVFLFAGNLLAEDGGSSSGGGLRALAVALAIGLAALGGTMGQGRAAASALEGISKNPSAGDKMFTPFILGLAFIESLVILAWLTLFLLK